jgi:hypothetical protein
MIEGFMKNILCLILISFLFVSCGPKGAGSKTKFKVFSGNLLNATSLFTGGILVMGRSLDNSQSFIVAYTSGMELDLKKGSWEFATIGWMGSYPLEGNQQCSYQKADLTTDTLALTFNMTYDQCLNNSTIEGNRFTEPYFYNQMGGTYNGFKKLTVARCPDIVANCTTFETVVSFKIDVLPLVKGLIVPPNGISSRCIDGNASNLTPPYGGVNGFIGTKITIFSGSGCSGTANEYSFDHGFGEILDKTFIDSASVTQIRKAALSMNPSVTNSILALKTLSFLGSWTSSSTLPTPAAAAADDLYYYMGVSVQSIAPYASPGNYIHYNGSGWETVTESDSVKLILQDY